MAISRLLIYEAMNLSHSREGDPWSQLVLLAGQSDAQIFNCTAHFAPREKTNCQSRHK